MKRAWTKEEIMRANADLRTGSGIYSLSSIAIELTCQRNVLRDALKFVQEKCQLYGAADAARERIESALAQTEDKP